MTELEKIEIAGFTINCPVMNAAGSCRTTEEVESLAKSCISIIEAGTFTIEDREENKGENFWVGGLREDGEDIFSLNSRGLPNLGIKYCKKAIPEMAAIVRKAGKLLCVSIAGFNPQEYAILAKLAFELGADIVELNLSCPNVWEGTRQKRIACFDPALVREILRRVEEAVGTKAKIFVKISPFPDPYALKEVADVISRFGIVKAVVSMNTFPNALLFGKKGCPRITVGEGLAGLGGPAVKPIALGQIKQLRSFLPENVAVVGVGGIINGQDIKDMQRAGASFCQVCTLLLKGETKPEYWPNIFTRLMAEYYGS